MVRALATGEQSLSAIGALLARLEDRRGACRLDSGSAGSRAAGRGLQSSRNATIATSVGGSAATNSPSGLIAALVEAAGGPYEPLPQHLGAQQDDPSDARTAVAGAGAALRFAPGLTARMKPLTNLPSTCCRSAH